MKKKSDIILQCRKCEHRIRVSLKNFQKRILDKEPDCPACGEQYDNYTWILIGYREKD